MGPQTRIPDIALQSATLGTILYDTNKCVGVCVCVCVCV